MAGAASVYEAKYERALEFFDRALRLDRELSDVPGEILRLNNIAGVHSFLGRYADAYSGYQTAIARLKGTDHQPWHLRSKQLSLGNLAALHQTLGQDDRALDLYREIRRLHIQLEPNIEAQILTNLAVVYRRLGDPRKALATYETARRLFDKDPHAAALLYTLRNIGVVQARDLDEYPSALQTFGQALKLAMASGNRREIVQQEIFLGETLLRMGRFAEAETRFRQAIDGAIELKLLDEEWTALAGIGRCHVALGRPDEAQREFEAAVAVIESTRAGLTNSLKEEFLAAKRDVYDELIALLVGRPNVDLAAILMRIEQGRARSLKDARPRAAAAVTIGAIQRALDPDSALLEYWTANGKMAVIWVTASDAGIVRAGVGPSDSAKIESLKVLLAKGAEGWQAHAAEVARLLMPAHLQDRLTGISKLLIAPDGPFSSIPFEILPLTDSRPSVERFAISYVPAAEFALTRRATDRRWPWQISLRAFADPISPAPSSGSFDLAWARLPYSTEEAESAARALPGRASIFVGQANLKATFVRLAREAPPVLHLATHAAVDPRDSRRSRLIFTPAPGSPASQYLYRDEISALPLAGVELVVLAACDSEQGRYIRGEGLEGFSAAFLRAGAASSIGSLWKVSDKASAKFMPAMYRHLASGETKAEALRKTKLEFMHSGNALSHPYYWAPFVITGEGHDPLPRTVPPALFLAIPALLAALLVLRRTRKRA